VLIDGSTREDVITFAGLPEAEDQTSYYGSPLSDTLGYSSTSTNRLWTFSVGGLSCKTVYFINQATGELATFYTSSRGFAAGRNVSVGTATHKAEHRLHKRAFAGCEKAIYLNSPAISTTFGIAGGHRHQSGKHSFRVRGGHVGVIVLHSRRHDIAGAFDCL
jgi:hypothetical protein